MNMSAPCVLSKDSQANQMSVLRYALSDSMDSCGVVLMPAFSYQRGKLYLEELKLMKELGDGSCNLDTSFVIPMTDQVDTRDERPMAVTARLVFPAPVDVIKHPFGKSDIRRQRRTREVKQLSSKALKQIED